MIAISGCKKKETYTVTFNANGGTGTMSAQTFTEGEAQTLTRNAFTYDGYAFSGWNTVQGGSGASYTDGQSITVNSDMTLYAQWTSNGPTVTFNANGGTGEMAPQTFTIGRAQALSANTFTRENHLYSGWNTSADGSGTAYRDLQEITISESITLYAQWHEYVDLGLPSGLLWATCNVGATTPEGYGDYFAWGETTTKETYDWRTYRYCNGNYNTLTKYCNNADYGNNGFTDALTTLEAVDDAATANWGAGWRTPTKEEMSELCINCTREYKTHNGVNGCLYTSRSNGNSIFMPATGYCIYSRIISDGLICYYWSSSLRTDDPNMAEIIDFYPDDYCPDDSYRYADYYRFCGQSVRAVCQSQN